MTDKERDRIECAIRHIQTAVDVDSWAAEIAVEAMRKLFGNSEQLDTISRAAAINAICEDGTQLERQGQYTMTMAERKQRDADILDALPYALPSAQPDIIACGDCKHWICHDRKCGFWNHGVKPLDWCCHAERRTE